MVQNVHGLKSIRSKTTATLKWSRSKRTGLKRAGLKKSALKWNSAISSIDPFLGNKWALYPSAFHTASAVSLYFCSPRSLPIKACKKTFFLIVISSSINGNKRYVLVYTWEGYIPVTTDTRVNRYRCQPILLGSTDTKTGTDTYTNGQNVF